MVPSVKRDDHPSLLDGYQEAREPDTQKGRDSWDVQKGLGKCWWNLRERFIHQVGRKMSAHGPVWQRRHMRQTEGLPGRNCEDRFQGVQKVQVSKLWVLGRGAA